jgi:hypothetical protein
LSKLAATGPRAAGSRPVNVVVETPAGRRNQSNFDENLALMVLPAGPLDPIEHFFVASCR